MRVLENRVRKGHEVREWWRRLHNEEHLGLTECYSGDEIRKN